jgi:hypothetical protein
MLVWRIVTPAGRVPSVAALLLCAGLAAGACGGGTLDAGRDRPHGLLPVDERNPVILYNDSNLDNWFGELAVLLANRGGPPLAGIIVTDSKYWNNLDMNAATWTDMLMAARASGLRDIPAITRSSGALLQRPADGTIDLTVSNNSLGAQLIVELSRTLSRPFRPLVVLAGTRLTDIADAYLIDHSVVDRVVVVASLGEHSPQMTTMGGPNGELDPWADWIVAAKFQYVQVSTYYDQTSDVAASDLASLPQNPLGDWMRGKQAGIRDLPQASDQVTVLSVGVRDFVVEVERSAIDPSATFDGIFGAPLRPDAAGNVVVVTKIQGPLAKSRLWQMLLNQP